MSVDESDDELSSFTIRGLLEAADIFGVVCVIETGARECCVLGDDEDAFTLLLRLLLTLLFIRMFESELVAFVSVL